MGHWAERLVEEVAANVGADPDREEVRRALIVAGQEMEVLAGRVFGVGGRRSMQIDTGGLPLAEIPDLHSGSISSVDDVHEVPDPVNPLMSTVLQVVPLERVVPTAIPTGDALSIAGQLVADAAESGRLSREYVIEWLGHTHQGDGRIELLRKTLDPQQRINVPILGASIGGWWFQVSRRLVWITHETPDDGRLVELLFDEAGPGHPIALAASEAVLIAVPLTSQPLNWAFSARVWPEVVKEGVGRPWGKIAKAIHEFGIPIVTVDSASSRLEIACQVLLLAYWHGYIGGDEPGLAKAVALAFPKQVDRVRRGTGSPDSESAAALLLEGLIHPGFDPARGADANRRYVSRKASIAVMEHRKMEAAERYPWTQLGISERRFYKLLGRFAQKVNGRYRYDQPDLVHRMTAYLRQHDKKAEIRRLALGILHERGFGPEAARKWLQRHSPEQAVTAHPR
jgi:hypothetical protein